VQLTERNLEKFRVWMMERGRQESTADLYVKLAATCGSDPNGLTHRLVARGALAPNTLRVNLAALRAWAKFSGDAELAAKLSDLRLPPARRRGSKEPLTAQDWKSCIRHIQTSPMHEALRHVLLIMAKRGLRSGDVLRIRRAEAAKALATGKLTYEGKGRKLITIAAAPIREELEALVELSLPMGRKWVQVRDLVTSSENPRVASNRVWRTSRRMAKAAGVDDVNPHRYRHTFAKHYLDRLAGDPNAIVKLQRYMGWESMATAARYVDHINAEQLDTIAAGLLSGLLE
jgi:integrase